MPRFRSISNLCYRLIQDACTKDYSGVNRWKNYNLVEDDPSGKCVGAFVNECFGDPFDYSDFSGSAGVQF